MKDKNPYQTPIAQINTQENENFNHSKFFSLTGRITRLRFLAYFFSFFFLLMSTFLIIFMTLAFSSEIYKTSTIFYKYIDMYFKHVLYLIMMINIVILSIRRLNDFNVSGWYSVIFIISYLSSYMEIIKVISITLSFILFLALTFIKGSSNENKYGPRPEKNSLAIKILGIIFPSAILFLIGINLI